MLKTMIPDAPEQALGKPSTVSSTEHGAPLLQPAKFTGYKFEHILISVTIAHNREIGQFDDSCAHQIEKSMKEYQGIFMVKAEAQYKHCSNEQHPEGCECGLCQQVNQFFHP